MSAAVLTALQTFLRQEERAEQFRAAARSYGRLRRRIELAMLFPPRSARRPPLDVFEDGDGGFVLVDGNATFAVAEQDGWETVPVRILAERGF